MKEKIHHTNSSIKWGGPTERLLWFIYHCVFLLKDNQRLHIQA